MISNFNFPRVTVNQQFTGTDVGTDAILPVAVIGPHFNVQTYADKGSLLSIGQYVPSTGIASTLVPNKTSKSVIKSSSMKVYIPDADIELYSTDTGITQVSGYPSRLQVLEDSVAINFRKSNSVARNVDVKTNVSVGDKVKLTTTSGTTTANIIGVLASSVDHYTIIVLDTPLTAGMSFTGLSIFRTMSIYIPADSVNGFVYTDTNKQAPTIIVSAELSCTITNSQGTQATGCNVLGGEAYTEYVERQNTYNDSVGVVAGGDYCSDACKELLGVCDKNNPLGMAVLAACSESGTNMVYFLSVEHDTVADYVSAVDLLGKDDSTYSIVICSEDEAVIQASLARVNVQSSLQIPDYKILWFGISNPDGIPEASGLTSTTTSGSAGSITVSFAAGTLFGKDIKAGDYLRAFSTNSDAQQIYTDFIITATNNDSTVTVTCSDATEISGATSLSVVRKDYTDTQLCNYIIARKCVSDRRATMIYADDLILNGEIVPNYVGAAASAGIRSREEPHRPLSNIELSVVSIAETHGLISSNLRTMGANGIWLLGNNAAGTPIIRRQVTTAAANDINYDEQSLTTNVDSICLSLKHIGQDMVGNSNISPTLITLLYDDLDALLRSYTSSTSISVGPQLLSYQLIQVAQDEVELDHVYASLSGQPPKPFNELNITFRLV